MSKPLEGRDEVTGESVGASSIVAKLPHTMSVRCTCRIQKSNKVHVDTTVYLLHTLLCCSAAASRSRKKCAQGNLLYERLWVRCIVRACRYPGVCNDQCLLFGNGNGDRFIKAMVPHIQPRVQGCSHLEERPKTKAERWIYIRTGYCSVRSQRGGEYSDSKYDINFNSCCNCCLSQLNCKL